MSTFNGYACGGSGMECVVDGKGEVVRAAEGKLLGEVMDEVRERIFKEGRVISEVRVDGEVVEGERQKELEGETAAGFSKVEVKTRVPAELAAETLAEVSRHLGQVEGAVALVVEHLEAGKVAEAMALFKSCCHIWGLAQETLRRVGVLLGLDYAEIDGDGRSVAESMGETERILHEINEVLADRDFVALADVLRQEFKPAMGSWRRIFVELSERISPNTNA